MKYPELLSEFGKLKEAVEKLSSGVSPSNTDPRIDLMAEQIGKLSVSIEELKIKISLSHDKEVAYQLGIVPTIKHSDYKPTGYVPQAYRRICDEILSEEFGMDCIENDKNLDFEVKIVVPYAYSTLSEQEKAAGISDVRSRIISRALGESGVRAWCEKVRENLNKYFIRSGIKSPFITSGITV